MHIYSLCVSVAIAATENDNISCYVNSMHTVKNSSSMAVKFDARLERVCLLGRMVICGRTESNIVVNEYDELESSV